MRTLLSINSSGRVSRSVTRRLTARFTETWRTRNADSEVIVRDLGLSPPSVIDEDWIEAAFDPAASRADALSESEELIGEIASADAIVMGVPMYNFGLPAALKAYFDQVVRIGRTFAYNPDLDEPYQALLSSKPFIVITSVSDVALHPGGAMAHLNFSEPHLTTMSSFIGIGAPVFIRADEGLLRNPPAFERIEAEVDRAAQTA